MSSVPSISQLPKLEYQRDCFLIQQGCTFLNFWWKEKNRGRESFLIPSNPGTWNRAEVSVKSNLKPIWNFSKFLKNKWRKKLICNIHVHNMQKGNCDIHCAWKFLVSEIKSNGPEQEKCESSPQLFIIIEHFAFLTWKAEAEKIAASV